MNERQRRIQFVTKALHDGIVGMVKDSIRTCKQHRMHPEDISNCVDKALADAMTDIEKIKEAGE